MVNSVLREMLNCEVEKAVILDNPSFDHSIIGYDISTGRLIYSLQKMVKELSQDEGMSEEEAEEFIDYNTCRSLPYMGERAPIIMMPLTEVDAE